MGVGNAEDTIMEDRIDSPEIVTMEMNQLLENLCRLLCKGKVKEEEHNE